MPALAWLFFGVLFVLPFAARAEEPQAEKHAVPEPAAESSPATETQPPPAEGSEAKAPAPDSPSTSANPSATDVEPPAGYPTPGYPEPYLRGPSISPAEATKLRVLEADLNVLAQLSGGRVLDSSLSIAAGAAFFTIGWFINDTLVSTLLEVTGSLSVARGVVGLVLLPDGEVPAREYTHMPMLTREQVNRRIAYGESTLARLGRETRRARLVDGSLTMLAGASYVPVYLLLRQNEEPDYHFADDAADWVAVGVGVVSFAAGLISVIRKSEAEQRARAYQKLKTDVDAHARASWPSLRLSVRPDGMSLSAGARF